jgi:hypothetical protein
MKLGEFMDIAETGCVGEILIQTGQAIVHIINRNELVAQVLDRFHVPRRNISSCAYEGEI